MDYLGIKFSNLSKNLVIHKITNITWIAAPVPSALNPVLTLRVVNASAVHTI